MRKKLFPKEIISISYESHFKKHSKSVKSIYLLIVILIMLFIVLLPFVKLTISTQARGVIQSINPSVYLIAPGSGRIEKCLMEENCHFKSGDTLVWIDQDKLNEKVMLVEDIIERNKTYLSDLNSLIKDNSKKLESDVYRQKFFAFNKKLSELSLEISIQKKEFERNEKLFQSGVIPIADFDRIKFKYQNSVKVREVFIESQKSEWKLEIKTLNENQRELLSELKQLNEERNFHFIISPVDGVVSNYKGQKEGSYLFMNQEVAMITPIDNLIVDVYVTPTDISFIKKGMKAKFQVDSYNYNQWGMGTGKVIDIAAQPNIQDDQVLFRVRCSLDQTHLKLKSGYAGALKNGLTLTSRFEITERTLLQIIYDKADNWLNPKLIAGNSES